VIAVVRLMREYLETEPALLPQPPTLLGPVLRSVVAELSPVAVERQVGLRLTGGCSSTVTLTEARLRLALHYLIGILIEEQPRHRDVTLRLEQSGLESELQAQAKPSLVLPARLDPVTATRHDVQLAIATRLLESAGAALVFDVENRSGFLLRIPRSPSPASSELSS
jgi:hypothetical protein